MYLPKSEGIPFNFNNFCPKSVFLFLWFFCVVMQVQKCVVLTVLGFCSFAVLNTNNEVAFYKLFVKLAISLVPFDYTRP